MRTANAKVNTPTTYTISAVDGQDGGQFWEYEWSILNNDENTPDQKGTILNSSTNTNKIYVNWLRETAVDETFVLKCIVKMKPTADTITCERDVYINVTVESIIIKLGDTTLTENLGTKTSQCKMIGSVCSYKACCPGATKIKWAINGGKIVSSETSYTELGPTIIKDAVNGCSEIFVYWNNKSATQYSVQAYGINGTENGNISTINEKLISETLEPIVYFTDGILSFGEKTAITLQYGLPENIWSSLPSQYIIKATYSIGTIKPSCVGDLNIDYDWSAEQSVFDMNVGSAMITFPNASNRLISITKSIPTTYLNGIPTKYRIKFKIEVKSNDTSLTSCVATSGELTRDSNLTFCPTADDIVLPTLTITKPTCNNSFIIGDIDAVAPPCDTSIVLGNVSNCEEPTLEFNNILTSHTVVPMFDGICRSNCVVVPTFDNICIKSCYVPEPMLIPNSSSDRICFKYCHDVIEFQADNLPIFTTNELPKLNSNILFVQPIIPMLIPNSSSDRTCFSYCRVNPEFSIANPITVCSCVNEIPRLENIAIYGAKQLEFNGICFRTQIVEAPEFSLDNGIVYYDKQNPTLPETISIVGRILPQFNNSPAIGYRDCKKVDPQFEVVSGYAPKWCSCSIELTPTFENQPCSGATPVPRLIGFSVCRHDEVVPTFLRDLDLNEVICLIECIEPRPELQMKSYITNPQSENPVQVSRICFLELKNSH